MTALSKSCILNDEDFLTATSVINSILNRRPIAKLNDDPEDFRVLTPSQLLGGGFEESANPAELLSAAGYRRSFKMLAEAVQGSAVL